MLIKLKPETPPLAILTVCVAPILSTISNFFCVGEINCRVICEFLSNDGICPVAEDLRGEDGRVIHFTAGDYAVYVRKVLSAKVAQRTKNMGKGDSRTGKSKVKGRT